MTSLALVTKVDIDESAGKIFVDVVDGPRGLKSGIYFEQPSRSVWQVPTVNDVVEIWKHEKTGETTARSVGVSDTTMPTGLSEGDIAIQINDNSFLRFVTQDDGTVDLKIDVDGDIFIGDEGSAIAVADANHTHQESGGGTTGGPSSVTTTKVE